LFVCGGWTSNENNRVLVDTIEFYNPEKDVWEVSVNPSYTNTIIIVLLK